MESELDVAAFDANDAYDTAIRAVCAEETPGDAAGAVADYQAALDRLQELAQQSEYGKL